MVAWRNASPCGKMSCCGEATHVASYLSDDLFCRRASNAWNCIQPLDGFSERGFGFARLFDGGIKPSNGIIQAVDLAQQLGEDEPMVCLNATIQGLRKRF